MELGDWTLIVPGILQYSTVWLPSGQSHTGDLGGQSRNACVSDVAKLASAAGSLTLPTRLKLFTCSAMRPFHFPGDQHIATS
jgi:hypothetical protein